jgi:hypothetical protein
VSPYTFSRRQFLQASFHAALTVGLAGIGSLKYAYTIEPDWLKIERLALKLKRLPPAFENLHLVQISDIHVDDWMNRERLKHLAETVNALKPDVVAITGDFVNHDPARNRAMMVEAFSSLDAREGVFAVLGNHDHWTDAGVVRQVLRTSGIIELKNDIYPLERVGQRLYLCGVDDIWEKRHDLERVIARLPAEKVCAILLAHEPDFADESAATGRFQLQLSGHSHGGQVVVPFMRPPVLPRLGQKYHTGLYRVGDMWQYTNRGIGTVQPRVRFNCRPEITSITLTAA